MNRVHTRTRGTNNWSGSRDANWGDLLPPSNADRKPKQLDIVAQIEMDEAEEKSMLDGATVVDGVEKPA